MQCNCIWIKQHWFCTSVHSPVANDEGPARLPISGFDSTWHRSRIRWPSRIFSSPGLPHSHLIESSSTTLSECPLYFALWALAKVKRKRKTTKSNLQNQDGGDRKKLWKRINQHKDDISIKRKIANRSHIGMWQSWHCHLFVSMRSTILLCSNISLISPPHSLNV